MTSDDDAPKLSRSETTMDDAHDAAPESPKAPEQPKAKKSNSATGVIGFIIALGGGFFIGQWINNRGKTDVELAEGPRYAVELRGDEPSKGPADALVTIIEFADYQCPYCEKAAGPLDDVAADYDDEVRILYKHYPLPGHPKAMPASRAAWAAHQQGKFWDMHGWFFAQKADLTQLEAKVDSLGLDRAKFLADMVSDAAAASIDGDIKAAGKLGVRSTPVFFVNGHKYTGTHSAPQWRSIIEAELEQAEALVDRGTPRAEVYGALMADALVRDDSPKPAAKPDEHDPRANYRVLAEDRPALGPADALVTVVLFSDYQCPYCSRLAATVHELVANHPDVRVVFRNLPLEMHPRARDAAKAALAAGRQGKYWEMHDAMFAAQKQLGTIDFSELAGSIGLDIGQFATDMADAELDRLITEDEAVARTFRVRGTPAAFVNGRFLGGAQPAAVFDGIIAEERARAQALVDGGTPRGEVFAKLMETALPEVVVPTGGSAP